MFKRIGSALAVCLLATGVVAASDVTYEVTITNLTLAQQFTPRLAVAHKNSIALFEVGSPALPELEILAEDGGADPFAALLSTVPNLVGGTTVSGGLVDPGATTTLTITAPRHFDRLSIAAMMIPTNDTFMAIDSLRLPRGSRPVNTFALAYDAGTEENDQNCNNMPGPRCGGEGFSEGPNEGDEGFVYISNGFHERGPGNGDGEILSPVRYDWRNPVAKVTVRRVTGR